ncbi:zinc finger protein 772 [Bicyclus anynana]|uniref:Zinc finger protein 772 n=1 Tax=Bicyclus anynana TaxID=110368 RepID=A0A6J1MW25_BICAN|nr:zinc finger protein 772 [Bicyclus anynana]
MESNIVNASYGKCRFCSSTGHHRDLMKEYNSNGRREVYYELFQECFNLYLCATRCSLICSSCVQSLQEASSFRSMVVEAESLMMNTLDEKERIFVNFRQTPKPTEIDVKPENLATVKLEQSDELDSITYECDDASEALSDYEAVEGEEALLQRFSADMLAPLPTAVMLKNSSFFQQLELLKDEIIPAKSIKNLIEQSPRKSPKIFYITEKLAHSNNVSTILEHSNVTAFKMKKKPGYQCYYCSRICDTFEKLHQHQLEENCRRNIKNLLNKLPAESLIVYVYITDVKCTICDSFVANLNELKTHLSRIHKKKFYSQFGDRVIPFKFTKNQYECVNCGGHYETFGAIERHMNVHFRNYVCDQCGAGYVTKSRLKTHVKCSHFKGNFPCDKCKKTFTTMFKYKSHVDVVHNMVKKHKCPYCLERFADYHHRQKHMVDSHGDTPLRYKCNVCDNLFKRRYALSCHMKRRHLELKDIKCTLCSYNCYTSAELKAHMVKHNGERTYECVVCKKSYARKRTLKEHMRIHNNDRRYVCVVCGHAFVQKCSLKGHMKAHHSDHLDNES